MRPGHSLLFVCYQKLNQSIRANERTRSRIPMLGGICWQNHGARMPKVVKPHRLLFWNWIDECPCLNQTCFLKNHPCLHKIPVSILLNPRGCCWHWTMLLVHCWTYDRGHQIYHFAGVTCIRVLVWRQKTTRNRVQNNGYRTWMVVVDPCLGLLRAWICTVVESRSIGTRSMPQWVWTNHEKSFLSSDLIWWRCNRRGPMERLGIVSNHFWIDRLGCLKTTSSRNWRLLSSTICFSWFPKFLWCWW